MTRMRFSNVLLTVVMLASLVLAACGGAQPTATTDVAAAVQALVAKIPDVASTQPQANKTYVGALKGTQAFIGLVIENDIVAGYICDGTDVSQWFNGKITGNKIDLTNAKGTKIVADVSAEAVNGTITLPNGQPTSFATVPAVQGTSGFYRQRVTKGDVTTLSGWIVTADGARGISEIGTNLANGLVLGPAKRESNLSFLFLLSDSNEYSIVFEGKGQSLHSNSVLELPVVVFGKVGFDVFCGSKKTFFGVEVPQGTTVRVQVNAKCEPQAGAPEPSAKSAGPLLARVLQIRETQIK